MSPAPRAPVVLIAAVLALASTSRADSAGSGPSSESSSKADLDVEAATKKTIAAYLRAEAKSDYQAMTALFTHDARLKYTYEWGSGYKDTVYELDFSDPNSWRDKAYLGDLDGYETVSRKHRIERLKVQAGQRAEALVTVTEKYRYQGYSGTAKTKLELVLREESGTVRIARLTSVSKY